MAWVLAIAVLADVTHFSAPTREDRIAAELLRKLETANGEEQAAIFAQIVEKKLVQALPAVVILGKENQLFVGPLDIRIRPKDEPDMTNLFEHLRELCLPFETQWWGRIGRDPWLDHPHPVVRYFAVARFIRSRIPTEIAKIRKLIDRAPVTSYPWLVPLVRSARASWSDDSIKNGLAKADEWAIAAAATSGDPKWCPEIQKILALKRKGDNRSALVWALGELRSSGSIPLLLAEMKNADDQASYKAAEALGKIGDPSVIPDLVKSIDGASLLLQIHIFWALGELGTEKEIHFLQRYASNDEYTGEIDLPRAAQRAIEQIKRRRR